MILKQSQTLEENCPHNAWVKWLLGRFLNLWTRTQIHPFFPAHGQNVNKLSRVFSLFVTFSDFLLNSCLKLVGTPVFQGRNYSRKMARAGSDFAFSSSGFAFSSSGQLGPRLDSRTSSSNTPKSSKKRLGRARARAQARSAPIGYKVLYLSG